MRPFVKPQAKIGKVRQEIEVTHSHIPSDADCAFAKQEQSHVCLACTVCFCLLLLAVLWSFPFTAHAVFGSLSPSLATIVQTLRSRLVLGFVMTERLLDFDWLTAHMDRRSGAAASSVY